MMMLMLLLIDGRA